MNRKDVEKIIKALQERPFICGANFIETEEYFITKKVVEQEDKQCD